MSTYFVKYSLETGQPTGGGEGSAAQVREQATETEGLIISDRPLMKWIEHEGMTLNAPDPDAIRAALHRKVDVEAGSIRAQFITDVPGQAQTYEKKEDEAKRWTTGGDAPQFPFLAAEASVRGVTIDQVQEEVLAQVAMLTPLAALIEAHRIAAKIAVTEAATVGAMVAAASVDWVALVTPPS